jgi:cation:H+ antiporter
VVSHAPEFENVQVNPEEWALPINVALFVAAGIVIWLAGTRLARYADAFAEKTGLGRVAVGMILLGGITSLPEITIATTSTLQGAPMLSVTDVLGSAALNVVILAIADATFRRGPLTSVQGSGRVMLQGVLGIVVMALSLGAHVAGDVLFLGIGVWSWLMLGVYIVSIVMLTSAGQAEAWRPAERRDKSEEFEDEAAKWSFARLGSLIAVAAAAILVAGVTLAETGTALAEQTGLGLSFFGAVFLAITTSLPEVSMTTALARRGQYEMAISGIFGTNLFNVTIIVLVDALHPGKPVLPEVGKPAAVGALIGIVLTSIFLVGLIERRNRAFLRMGYDSIAVLLSYAAGLVVLYLVRG